MNASTSARAPVEAGTVPPEPERIELGAGDERIVLLRSSGRRDPERSVLYLHGLGSSQEGEKARYFRSRCTGAGLGFCSLDLRGHGASGGALAAMTISRNLDDVERARALLRTLGVERTVLFGSSMGGLTALWSSVRDSSDVESVLAISPAVGLRRALLDRVGGDEAAERWRTTGLHRFESELGAADIGWELIRDLERYGPERLANELRVPALFFQGCRDDSVRWDQVAELAAACRRAPVRVLLFGDGDHRLVDRLDELWEAAARFLGVESPRHSVRSGRDA